TGVQVTQPERRGDKRFQKNSPHRGKVEHPGTVLRSHRDRAVPILHLALLPSWNATGIVCCRCGQHIGVPWLTLADVQPHSGEAPLRFHTTLSGSKSVQRRVLEARHQGSTPVPETSIVRRYLSRQLLSQAGVRASPDRCSDPASKTAWR